MSEGGKEEVSINKQEQVRMPEMKKPEPGKRNKSKKAQLHFELDGEMKARKSGFPVTCAMCGYSYYRKRKGRGCPRCHRSPEVAAVLVNLGSVVAGIDNILAIKPPLNDLTEEQFEILQQMQEVFKLDVQIMKGILKIFGSKTKSEGVIVEAKDGRITLTNKDQGEGNRPAGMPWCESCGCKPCDCGAILPKKDKKVEP
jgi:hypothetical protein